MTRRGRRIFLIAGIAAVVLASYAWLFGFQTAMILETRWMARKCPVIELIPAGLGDKSVSSSPGTKLSYFGYEFEVPWTDLDQSKTKLHPNHAALMFRSGKSLIFTVAPPRQFVNTMTASFDRTSFRQFYGDEPL